MRLKTTKKKSAAKQLTHDNVPATVGLVKEVRKELRADIQVLRHEMGSFRHEMGSFRHELGSSRQEVYAKFEQVMVVVHRTQVLMEEQRGENRIVLDGLKTVLERQDRVESVLSRHSLL